MSVPAATVRVMTDVDWFVVIAALGIAGAGVGWYGYRRWWRRALTPADLEFAVVDPLSDAGFTRYCAALLRLLGYQRVRRVRGGAVSLTATAPDGAPVAIRCAHQKEAVTADAVRALRQGITDGGQAGRGGILVTNALVTPDARALAADSGITMTDRAVLRHWMELARAGGLGAADAASPGIGTLSGTASRARTRAPGVDTLVLGGSVGCATLMLIAVVVHAASETSAPGNSAASVAAANTQAAPTPADTASTGHPAGATSAASGGDSTSRERHVLHVEHVKHVEHMDHLEYLEQHAPGQQG